jgi:outer membrane autotransporter protein
MLGSKQLTVGSNNLSTALGGVISDGGTAGGSGGSLVKVGTGTLSLTGNNTYTGPTTVNGGTLSVNGSLASSVTVNSGGTLAGSGTVGGATINGGAIVAPGNSIGTLSVNGGFTQSAGSIYQVQVNNQGQADKINVNGTATLGGTVQVQAQPGTYGPRTTYTIVTASGGVNGTYAGVSSNFAFLTPSLSYDANDVYLVLLGGSFAAGAQTPNQYAVGAALDAANASATGDFNTVLNALSLASTTQGPALLNAISGQQWADFGTVNINNSVLFMNALGQQMANARGAPGSAPGQRAALAEACDVAACDAGAPGPWGMWASAIGGLGSVAGNFNSGGLSYNFGGGAAGIDYRLDPRAVVGIGTGYTSGNMWVNGFSGQGFTNSVSVAAYGSFTQSHFYVDTLVGYANYSNWLNRSIVIPGLSPRVASGTTSANQVLGQAEAGYKVDVFAPARASVTPFALFQGSSVTQNGFNEGGANSLSLTVQSQTTTSLRSIFGAELAGSIGIGNMRSLDLDFRLGWQHEYANTARPITASFAGAPAYAFTVYGATPATDSAVVGFSAKSQIADNAQLYLRYDGQIGTGTDNHALNLGVRFTW